MFTNPITIVTTCPICKESHEVTVEFSDYLDWKCGKLSQEAFPYLSANDREMLISNICPTCWDKMFGQATSRTARPISEISS